MNVENKTAAVFNRFKGRFQGRIGIICEYAVYAENGVTHLYHDDNKGGDQAPDYSGSENGAYAFAGVKPFVRVGIAYDHARGA